MSSCLRPAPCIALAAALLAAVQVGLGALGVAGLGDGDDDVLALDEVLVGDVAVGGDDAGPSSSPCLSAISASSSRTMARCRSGLARMSSERWRSRSSIFGQIVDDRQLLHAARLAQLHVEDGSGLDLVDVEQLHQPDAVTSALSEARIRRSPSSSARVPLTRPAGCGPAVGLAQPAWYAAR